MVDRDIPLPPSVRISFEVLNAYHRSHAQLKEVVARDYPDRELSDDPYIRFDQDTEPVGIDLSFGANSCRVTAIYKAGPNNSEVAANERPMVTVTAIDLFRNGERFFFPTDLLFMQTLNDTSPHDNPQHFLVTAPAEMRPYITAGAIFGNHRVMTDGHEFDPAMLPEQFKHHLSETDCAAFIRLLETNFTPLSDYASIESDFKS